MDKENTFFAKLKTIASDVEKQVDEAKTKYDEKGDVCVPAILTSMYGVNKEVKQVKEQVKASLKETKQHVEYLDKILADGKALLGKLSTEMDEKEKYLQQYGYIPYDVKGDEKEDTDVQQEDDSLTGTDSTVVVQPQTPSTSRLKPTNVNRTPEMEDFGISQETLDMIKALDKRKTAKQTTGDVDDSIQKQEEKSVNRTDLTYCVKSGSLLSGKIETNRKLDKQHQPVSSSLRAPQAVPDCFQHDGLMMTPSVFGREIDRSVLNIHESLASPFPVHETRDFQREFDASSTTKLFSRDLPAFPNLAAYSDIKENVSPKEPELLSQNTSHTMIERKSEEPRGKKSLFDDDLPQSPKLYGNYGISSN